MKTLLKSLILTSALSLSPSSHALDGGAIEIMNNTTLPIYVTYSGVGCGEFVWGLTFVCESAKITHLLPNVKRHVYAWGVTKTWLNMSFELTLDPQTGGQIHPCSPDSDGSEKCFLDHHVVDTTGGKVSYCVISADRNNENVEIACNY